MAGSKLSFTMGTFSTWYSCEQLRSDKTLVPDVPGIYAVVDREEGTLVYVGKAMGNLANRPRGLRDRVFKEHLKPRSRGSALRRHIAAALGIPVYRDHSNHDTADGTEEPRISRFLDGRALFAFVTFPWISVSSAEDAARRELKPKWNPL